MDGFVTAFEKADANHAYFCGLYGIMMGYWGLNAKTVGEGGGDLMVLTKIFLRIEMFGVSSCDARAFQLLIWKEKWFIISFFDGLFPENKQK